jgi:WD40 repeat protein/tetratricopeptide (TPR) repeat protein
MSTETPQESPAPATEEVTPFRSLTSMREAHSELIRKGREDGDAERSPEFVNAIIIFVRRAVATGTILDQHSDRSAAQGLVDYWLTIIYRSGRDFPDAETTLADFDISRQPELSSEDCPYLGLETFSETKAEFFFGRKNLLNQWIARLAEDRLMAVVGPSGSGKASLITAGVVPALRNGALEGSEHWRYFPPVPPGAHPLRNVLAVVQDGHVADPEKWVKKMRENSKILLELIESESKQPAVFVFPRFEEVFILADEAERKALGNNLLEIIKSPRGHRVLLAMRNDFVTHIGQLGGLQAVFQKGEVFVPPLDASELHEIVQQPAERVGLKFDDGVVDALIFDVLGDPAALPLLQFTLLKLWEKRERNRITWNAYHDVGGCRGAFARAGDEMWAGLDPTMQEIVKSILLRIVRSGSGRDIICSTVHRASLSGDGRSKEQVDGAIAALLRAGLVRISGHGVDERIGMVNEALVTKWPRLVEWLEDQRVNMRERRRFTIAAEQWKEKGGDQAVLLRGAVLDEARNYKELNDLEERFLTASIEADDAWNRWRMIIMTAAILAAVAVVFLGVLNFWQYIQRSKATEEALRLANVERGMRLLDANDPAGGAVWFAELFKHHPPKKIKDNVYRRRLEIDLRQLPRLLAILPHDREVLYADMSGDGRHIVTLTSTGEPSVVPTDGNWATKKEAAWLWPNENSGEPKPYQLSSELPANSVRISPDGKLVAVAHGKSGGGQGEVLIWDISEDAPKSVRQIACEGAVALAIWSPDSTRVAIAQEVGTSAESVVRILSARAEGEAEVSHPFEGKIATMAWSPKGDRIAIAGQDQTLTRAEIWDLATNEKHPLEEESVINDIVFSSDGGLVLTAAGVRGSEAGSAQLWKGATGKRIGPALSHRGAVLTAQFSPDDKLVVTASTDGTAKVWSSITGKEILALAHDSWVFWAAFSPDGRHIATGGRDRMARIWELLSGELAGPPMNTGGTIARIAFSSDGRRVLTTGRETPRLWAFSTGYKSPPPLNTESPISETVLSGDGSRLATINEVDPGKTWNADVWDIATGQQVLKDGYASSVALTQATMNDDGSLLLVTSFNADARKYGAVLINTASGSVTQRFELESAPAFIGLGHGKAPPVVILTRDEKGQSRIARTWSSETGQPLSAPLDHDVQLNFAAFSPDDSALLITGGETTPKTGKAFLRRTAALGETPKILTHTEVITRGGFSNDGSKVVTASDDNCARVWSATDGQDLSPLLNHLHTADLTDASFDPSGNRIVTASYDATAVVTDWKSGKVIATFKHVGVVNRARFSRDGSLVVTASSDGAARLWHVGTNELIAMLKPGGAVKDATFSRDGKSIAALSARGAGIDASFQKGVPVATVPDDALELPRTITPARIWEIELAKEYSEAELQEMAEMLAVQSSKKNGQLELLPSGELLKRWRRLSSRYLGDFHEELPTDYHTRCALLAEAAKQWYAVAWHLTKLLEQNGPDGALRLRRATAYIHLNKPKLAVTDLTVALQATPDDTYLLKQRARAYIGTQLAVEDIDVALRAQPDDPTLQARRAEAVVGPEDWEMAAADCEKAAKSNDPSSAATAGLMLAAIRSQQQRWPEALEQLSSIVARDKENYGAWQRLALVQIKSGDLAGYRATCADMIDKFKDRRKVGSIIAWPAVLNPDGVADYGVVVDLARNAVNESPRNYYRINTLAGALYRAGRYAEALTELERSRNLFASSIAARIAALRDDSFAQTFSEPRLGRAQDWVFLAMANFKLGNKSAADWWLGKLRQTATAGAGTEINSERRLWNRIELDLLSQEARSLISPAGPPIAQ